MVEEEGGHVPSEQAFRKWIGGGEFFYSNAREGRTNDDRTILLCLGFWPWSPWTACLGNRRGMKRKNDAICCAVGYTNAAVLGALCRYQRRYSLVTTTAPV